MTENHYGSRKQRRASIKSQRRVGHGTPPSVCNAVDLHKHLDHSGTTFSICLDREWCLLNA